MSKKNNWLKRAKQVFASSFDLPQDVVLDLPRITMIGQIHIYIENHKGILTFSNEELRLALKQGYLLIKGVNFVLKTILPEEILLEGTIHQVTFVEEDKN
ncbi:MAG: yqfC [Bacillales bacterium]|jgi:sporulation protein YqfC|nr:yqfC [Bacillales bacterium]